MKTFPHLIVCEHCDSVCCRQTLSRREVARCERCNAVLYRARALTIDQWLALTVASAIVFVLANISPVVRISMQGLHNDATLWQSVLALDYGAVAPIAVPAALTIIVVPFLQILLLGWVLMFARLGRIAPGFILSMRALAVLRPWSMVEVCLLGVLVAIVKLSSYLDVVAGTGLWACAVLTILLTVIASRDTHQLWDLLRNDASDGKHS